MPENIYKLLLFTPRQGATNRLGNIADDFDLIIYTTPEGVVQRACERERYDGWFILSFTPRHEAWCNNAYSSAFFSRFYHLHPIRGATVMSAEAVFCLHLHPPERGCNTTPRPRLSPPLFIIYTTPGGAVQLMPRFLDAPQSYHLHRLRGATLWAPRRIANRFLSLYIMTHFLFIVCNFLKKMAPPPKNFLSLKTPPNAEAELLDIPPTPLAKQKRVQHIDARFDSYQDSRLYHFRKGV